MNSSPTTMSASRHVGPPALPLALVSVALFAASLVIGATGGGPFPSPYDHTRDVIAFFSGHATTVRLAGSVASRLQATHLSGVRGVLIDSTGGTLASGMLAVSALAQWVLSRPGT